MAGAAVRTHPRMFAGEFKKWCLKKKTSDHRSFTAAQSTRELLDDKSYFCILLLQLKRKEKNAADNSIGMKPKKREREGKTNS